MRTSNAKAIAAIALTGVGSAFVLGFRTADEQAIDPTAQVDSNPTGTTGTGSTGSTGTTGSSGTTGTTGGSTSSSGGDGSSAGTGGTGSTAAYADGTWTGSAISEPWGEFQVKVVVSGGTITDVSVVESPSDRRSNSINRQAVPILTEETLQSQDASVDFVSGATWTSDSYVTSLQSALDEAARAA